MKVKCTDKFHVSHLTRGPESSLTGGGVQGVVRGGAGQNGRGFALVTRPVVVVADLGVRPFTHVGLEVAFVRGTVLLVRTVAAVLLEVAIAGCLNTVSIGTPGEGGVRGRKFSN